MTIDEVKKEKKQCESDILIRLLEFQTVTGLDPTEVFLKSIESIPQEGRTLYEVEIEVLL